MNEFEKNYMFLGKVFDIPIAEVVYKEHHGMFFFSKIQVSTIYFNRSEAEFILDPLEVIYFDLVTNKMTVVWNKSKKDMDHAQDMKSAIQEWIEIKRIPANSIIDYGPYSRLRSLSGFIMGREELESHTVNPASEGNPGIASSLLSKVETMKIFNENKEEDKDKLKQLKATLFKARYDHVMGRMKGTRDIRKDFKNRN